MHKLKLILSPRSCAVIFGDGSKDFKEAATRLGNQAVSLAVFSKVIVLDSVLLSEISPLYKQDLEEIFSLAEHPLYFRAIKPWAILACMQDANDQFDVVFYIDAGCELPNNLVSRIRMKYLLLKAFYMGSIAERTGYKETTYTKRNLIEHFNVPMKLISLGQVQSTWSMFKNSDKNKEFMLEWIKLSDPKLDFWQDVKIKDLKNQFSDFIEHRHDQSIFSLLYKKYEFKTKKTYWQFSGKFGRLRGLSIPIHATRNKTGKSDLPSFHSNNFLAIISLLLNFIADCFRVSKSTIHRLRCLTLHRRI
jgi:hypothetical protein